MKRDNKAIGKRSSRKGKVYERWVAGQLAEALWPGAKRGIGQAREAGEVPDVDGTPYWIEAKHRKQLSVHAAYLQAVDAKATNADPRPAMVVSRLDHTVRDAQGRVRPSVDLVTVSLGEWIKVVTELELLRAAFDRKTGE
jgi:hypothetical protein